MKEFNYDINEYMKYFKKKEDCKKIEDSLDVAMKELCEACDKINDHFKEYGREKTGELSDNAKRFLRDIVDGKI